ncbi:MAG: DUF4177 domain-containing protein [Pirellulales bacterium]|nr:DUF4177 domain-containing protein [Pirellulales bacterium]
MTRWEYKTIKLTAKGFFAGGKVDERELDTLMNNFGDQGWELVAAFDTNQWPDGITRDVFVLFKRPKS